MARHDPPSYLQQQPEDRTSFPAVLTHFFSLIMAMETSWSPRGDQQANPHRNHHHWLETLQSSHARKVWRTVTPVVWWSYTNLVTH